MDLEEDEVFMLLTWLISSDVNLYKLEFFHTEICMFSLELFYIQYVFMDIYTLGYNPIV